MPGRQRRSDRWAVREQILRLDPERDHLRIHQLSVLSEFPWDVQRALELALYRTFAIPSIAAVLDGSGEFRLRAQKRYDDTALLLAEILDHGYDSAAGRAALSRLNRIHAHFPISQQDYRYVLATFVFLPMRWLDRWGWRPLTQHERLASLHYYRALGARMGIRDIPTTLADLEREFEEYEATQVRPGPAQAATAVATRELLVSWLPHALAPAVRLGVHALLEDRQREAFGFPAPPAWLPPLVDAGLRLRARVERRLPPRRRPMRVEDSSLIRSYPGGWRVEDLGPAGLR